MDNDEKDGSSETASRLRAKNIPTFESPRATTLDIGENRARLRVAYGVIALCTAVFSVDIIASWRFWKDLHDVADTLAPFITLTAGAIGAAATYFFTDRTKR